MRASQALALMLKSQLLEVTSWLLAGRLTSNLLGLASSLITERLLMPEDFGLMAIAMSVFASAAAECLSGPRLFS
jgi:O-antigen/teichoic acid export membrane protein